MLKFFMFANQSLVFMHIESSDLPLSYFQVTAGREEMLRMCPILPMERERERERERVRFRWVFATINGYFLR